MLALFRKKHVLQVHGDMHGLLGGSFNCNVDFKSFYEKNKSKYSPGLLTFLLSYVTTTLWPDNAVTPGYNTCDTSCERGDTDCGCTCNVDAMSMTADEVQFVTVLLFVVW